VASRPVVALPATSRRLLHSRTLPVPRYSQMIHRGEYPQYGGGGEAWCSPTALSMLLSYYHVLPSASNYAWVNDSYANPWVDHVARVVYDYGYRGAGNWAFNTAYAANLTEDAFVTRLKNLREAEKFIAAGIPLAASISFSRGQLSGAPISATAGHLVVIAGFTKTGDVVVNDPAAPSNSSVRRTYDRGQFEKAWLRKSSGTVYVVRNSRHPLPARGSSTGW
jgi:peptidase C39-like protein